MIAKLHYITQEVQGKTHQQLAEEACQVGATWVQLRVKNESAEEWKAIALETISICKKHQAKLIINDNVTLAKEIGADGVHLGKQDLSTLEARKILGTDFIIGGTANTFEDIKMHVAAKVDYIGLGPFKFTSTKEKLSPIVGLEGYKRIMKQCEEEGITIPIIAIGGITPHDVEEIINTGVYGVAIAGYINYAENKSKIVKEFLFHLEANKLKV